MSTATLSAPSIADRVAAAFPFECNKLPLFGPEGLPTPHYGIFRSDNADCVGSTCSRKYEPHTRDDVAAICEASAEAFGDDLRLVSKFADGHRLIMGAKSAQPVAISGRDTIAPRLIVRAGYDGRAFSAWLGYYRGVCENLDIIRPVLAGAGVSGKIRHTAGLRDKMPALVAQFRAMAGEFGRVVETAQKLAATEVTLARWLDACWPIEGTETPRQRSARRRRNGAIGQRILRERQRLGGLSRLGESIDRATAWEAYQGVQGYVQHDANRQGRPDNVARALIALDSPIVLRAQELAAEAIAV